MVYNINRIYDDNGNTILKTFHTIPDFDKRSFREHNHTAFEIFYINKGYGIYTTSSNEYSFGPGDVFIFSTNETHCITKIQNTEPLDATVIHFEPRYIWADKFSNMNLLKIFYDRNEIFQNKLPKENPALEKIISNIHEIEYEFENKKNGFETAIRINILNILLVSSREFNYVNDKSNTPPRKNTLSAIEVVMKYIDTHLHQDISLDELADIAHINRSYFSTTFKKLNGMSPWDYIISKRIEKSINLLKNTDLTILDIATSCGFSHTSNFYHAFKKFTNKTPKDFRQS